MKVLLGRNETKQSMLLDWSEIMEIFLLLSFFTLIISINYKICTKMTLLTLVTQTDIHKINNSLTYIFSISHKQTRKSS